MIIDGMDVKTFTIRRANELVNEAEGANPGKARKFIYDTVLSAYNAFLGQCEGCPTQESVESNVHAGRIAYSQALRDAGLQPIV